ncbi:MAG: helicase [Phycisphaerae bacterium]|nr:helicase [Phycisphaerae bacterium]
MIAFTGQEGLDAEKLLGPAGLIACQWTDFESRPEQLEMARHVQKALRGSFHLAVEAGTGIGKSFAYLAGAIDQALRQQGKVIISTYTINLQEQLIQKDIPFLRDILPEQFTARLAKGRNHYLCKRRLEYALKRQMSLFEDDPDALIRVAEWARETTDGSSSDLPFVPPMNVWQAVQSEHGNCKGRKCPYFSKCFYWRTRRQLETADIIVANHALLFSDLVLKQSGVGVLPDYQSIIIDEAHNIEHVAEDHFGIRISQFSIAYLLDRLFHPKKRKGILSFQKNAEQARQLVKKCRQAMQVFFAQVQAWYVHAGEEQNGRCEAEFVEDNLSTTIKTLRLCLSKLGEHTQDEDEQYEILRYADKLAVLESDIKDFLFQRKEGCVYWVESERNRHKRIILRCAPLDVGPYLKSHLFDAYQSVILTSATLSCSPKAEEGFSFFSNRIGLEKFSALQLGSPFNYQQQVKLYIESNLPDPNDPTFPDAACNAIKKYLLKSEGRAFVLFTSYVLMKEAVQRLEGWLAEQQMELFVQGGQLNRMRMLESFKQDTRSVLFGTDSFWQGVDVPGESLSNVIIVRLPFAVPNHPLIQGRIELLRQRGENPFFNYQLPMAIIKFKQGFGRLIRSKNDTGMVVVLDRRIVQKTYGRKFIEAIPTCHIEMSTDTDFNHS